MWTSRKDRASLSGSWKSGAAAACHKRARVRNMSDDRYSKHGKSSNQAERPRVPAVSRRDVVARGGLALGSVLSAGYLMKQGLSTAHAAEMLKIGVPLEITGPIAEEAEEM